MKFLVIWRIMINKNVPLVSVIVTTYNRKEYLKETLDSILNQTFKDSELIVVDNFSNYDFIPFIKSFKDNRIRYFQNENNGIIAVNRNIGIKKAKGDYLAFCDDDDLWMPEKLETQLKHFENEDIIGVGTSAIFIGDNDFLRNKKLKRNEIYNFKSIIVGNNVFFSSLMVKNLGFFFDEREDFKFVEDYDFQINITLKTKKYIKLLQNILIKYRIHTFSGSMNFVNKEKSFNVIQKYQEYLSNNMLKNLYRKKFYRLGWKALKHKYSKSTLYFLKSLKSSSTFKEKIIIVFFIVLSFVPKFIFTNILKLYLRIRKILSNQKYKKLFN